MNLVHFVHCTDYHNYYVRHHHLCALQRQLINDWINWLNEDKDSMMRKKHHIDHRQRITFKHYCIVLKLSFNNIIYYCTLKWSSDSYKVTIKMSCAIKSKPILITHLFRVVICAVLRKNDLWKQILVNLRYSARY